MPFTFAHPAAVVPFYKRTSTLSFTALVLGSMAPDLEYFVHFKPYAKYGHTFLGFFIFNLPLVLSLGFIWNFVMKGPLIRHLPMPFAGWYDYHAREKRCIRSVKGFIVFSYSAILGMITHVVWDALTHKYGYFVVRLPLLQHTIELGNMSIPLYKIAQHGSTVVGLVIVGFFLYKVRGQDRNSYEAVSPREKLLFWLVIAVLALFILMVRYISVGGISIRAYGEWIVSLMSCSFISLTIVSLLYYNRNR